MTAADFEQVKTLWTDENVVDGTYDPTPDDKQGAIYFNILVVTAKYGTVEVGNDKTDPVRSLEEFTAFKCGAVDQTPPTAGKQLCYKYQLKDDETFWSDGYPRFERTMRVQTYLISGIGIKEDYALSIGETILTGASLLAVGAAIATSMIALF